MKKFERYANSVVANAATYKSQVACSAAITKLNNLFRIGGSYGNLNHLRVEAISALQDRFLGIKAELAA